MPHVYLLRCADGSTYVGSTGCLEQRLQEHHDGLGAEYTRRRLPVELLWAEERDSVADCYALEKQLQGWSRVKREALARGDWDEIRRLARRRGVRRQSGSLERGRDA